MGHLDKSQLRKYPVLFSLYVAQSVPMSFFSTVVPIIMRQEHYSLQSIGLLQLVKLPWILKFLWGPVVDNNARTDQSIRRWIFSSELLYALLLIGIGFFNLQTDFKLIIGLVILAFIASAFQDIATDIFAIRILSSKERGYGNGFQAGGSFVGSLLGTGVLLILYHYLGWTALLALLAVFVLVAVLPLAFFRTREQLAPVPAERIRFRELGLFFRQKGSAKRTFLLIFFYSGIIGILSMLKPYLVDHGYSLRDIGFFSGIVGTSCAAVTALIAGHLIRKMGLKKAFHAFALINLLVAVVFLLIEQLHGGTAAVLAGICLLWTAYGLSTVAIYTMAMDVVRPGREGTDFTLQIVLTHLSSLVLTMLSGKLGDAFGFSGMFVAEILFGLLAWGVVFVNFPLRKKLN